MNSFIGLHRGWHDFHLRHHRLPLGDEGDACYQRDARMQGLKMVFSLCFFLYYL